MSGLCADIICLQEVKVTRERLVAMTRGCEDRTMFEDWDSFWSFSSVKKGYAGCTTFSRKGTVRRASACIFESRTDLNQEGRCVVTDHGDFIVFNVYVPYVAHDGPEERMQYRKTFLEELLREMMRVSESWTFEGAPVDNRGRRFLILAGDLNACASPQDLHWMYRVVHIQKLKMALIPRQGEESYAGWNALIQHCELESPNDPYVEGEAALQYMKQYCARGSKRDCHRTGSRGRSVLEDVQEMFCTYGSLGRENAPKPWTVDNFLGPLRSDLSMVDSFLEVYARDPSNRMERFTCWDQSRQARFENIGSRIDAIYLSAALVHADRNPRRWSLERDLTEKEDTERSLPVSLVPSARSVLDLVTNHGVWTRVSGHSTRASSQQEYDNSDEHVDSATQETMPAHVPCTGMIYTPPRYSDHIAVSVLLRSKLQEPQQDVWKVTSYDASTRECMPPKCLQQKLTTFFEPQAKKLKTS